MGLRLTVTRRGGNDELMTYYMVLTFLSCDDSTLSLLRHFQPFTALYSK